MVEMYCQCLEIMEVDGGEKGKKKEVVERNKSKVQGFGLMFNGDVRQEVEDVCWNCSRLLLLLLEEDGSWVGSENSKMWLGLGFGKKVMDFL